MNPDFLDIIRALLDADARFIVVGAYALNVYVNPRATGDLGVWVQATPENAAKVISALRSFGAPLSEISESDFARPGQTYRYQMQINTALCTHTRASANKHGGGDHIVLYDGCDWD
jgi:hypothetical protein